MNLQDLLNQLAQRLEMPPIPLSDDGFFHLRLGDDLRLRLAQSEDSGELVLLATLMNLPAGEAGVAVLTVQNLSPLRQVLELPDPWCLLDGPSKGWLQPWQLLSVRVGRCNR